MDKQSSNKSYGALLRLANKFLMPEGLIIDLHSGRNIISVGTSNIGTEIPFSLIQGGELADERHPLVLGYIQDSHYLRYDL